MTLKKSKHRIYMVDVFAEQRYSGNPLAVVFYGDEFGDENMQSLAAEINYSETTFVDPEPDENGVYRVRIFTPSREIEFTGHPILGTGWVIRQYLESKSCASIWLNTAVGQVEVIFESIDKNREAVWFRAPEVSLGTVVNRELIAPALNVAVEDIDSNRPVQLVSAGTSALIVPLTNLSALNRCMLNLQVYDSLLASGLPPLVYVFCDQTIDSNNDISARFFFEAHGLREDPATGNGAAFLGAYLLEHRGEDKGLDLRIEQGHSVRRPSLIMLRANRHKNLSDIRVGGYVLPTLQGELL